MKSLIASKLYVTYSMFFNMHCQQTSINYYFQLMSKLALSDDQSNNENKLWSLPTNPIHLKDPLGIIYGTFPYVSLVAI